jgi:hypothetical protein
MADNRQAENLSTGENSPGHTLMLNETRAGKARLMVDLMSKFFMQTPSEENEGEKSEV